MADEQFIQARLRRTTAQRLREWSQRVLKSVESGRVGGHVHSQGFVSLDVCVSILLDRDERHAERGRRGRKRE